MSPQHEDEFAKHSCEIYTYIIHLFYFKNVIHTTCYAQKRTRFTIAGLTRAARVPSHLGLVREIRRLFTGICFVSVDGQVERNNILQVLLII